MRNSRNRWMTSPTFLSPYLPNSPTVVRTVLFIVELACMIGFRFVRINYHAWVSGANLSQTEFMVSPDVALTGVRELGSLISGTPTPRVLKLLHASLKKNCHDIESALRTSAQDID
jgi:hypothetical protein